jgi:selenocysteine lyase/cysteine desulfurase
MQASSATLLPSQRHLFDIPRDVAYINCAYFGPFLNRVRERGRAALDVRVHPWTIDRARFFDEVENVRAMFARLIGADADAVSIAPSSSYAIAVAAANVPLGRGQNVVVPQHEHPSNFYVWHQKASAVDAIMRIVPRPADGDWTAVTLSAIDSATAVVAVPPCHWSDGSAFDLVAISTATRRVGAALVIDGTQFIGAAPFDLAAIRPDFVACSAYKWLLSPYVLAFLYAAPHRQNGVGLEHHGFNRAGARQSVGGWDHVFELEKGARRYDMGERSNFINLPMTVVALEQLLDWTPAAIAATIAPMTRRVAEGAAAMGFGSTVGQRVSHLIGLTHTRRWPSDVAERLWEEDRVHVSLRGDRLRISPHVYNDAEDVERLLKALKKYV